MSDPTASVVGSALFCRVREGRLESLDSRHIKSATAAGPLIGGFKRPYYSHRESGEEQQHAGRGEKDKESRVNPIERERKRGDCKPSVCRPVL